MFIAVVFFELFFGATTKAENPCVPAFYGGESIVCVCNETYCDSIPKLPEMMGNILYLYTSSKDGQRFNLSEEMIAEGESAAIDVLLTAYPMEKLQTILGFGGAFTDTASHVINGLNKEARENLLQAYFGSSGLQYTLARVPLGCTDFSLREYSFDPQPGDYNMSAFHLTEEETGGKIPLILNAQSLANQKLKLIGCAWAAPSWMKVDNKILSSGDIKFSCYDAWANYHVRFLEAYNTAGLKFWGLSTGNEPELAFISIHWNPPALKIWIKDFIGPKLKENFPEVRLLLLDDSPKSIPRFSQVMADPSSAQYLSGWNVHPYFDIKDISPNLKLAHRSFPNKMILSTEFTVGVRSNPSVILGSWVRSEDYAIRIIKCLNNWAVGWIDWNLALNKQGGPTFLGNFVDSAIIVDSSNTFYKQPTFYIQGHFAKFLEPGSVRIHFSLEPEGILDGTVSLSPNGNLVFVILNRNEEARTVGLRISNTTTHLTIPGRSIITALLKQKPSQP